MLDNISNKFKWWTKAATKKDNVKRGRAKGGQLIGVKKNIVNEWNVSEWDFGLILMC